MRGVTRAKDEGRIILHSEGNGGLVSEKQFVTFVYVSRGRKDKERHKHMGFGKGI